MFKICNYHSVYAVVLTVFVVCTATSCLGDTSDDSSFISSSKITITANANSVLLGQTLQFTVVDNLNQLLTDTSMLFVNGEQITGNQFTPDSPGTYEIYATNGVLTSNTLSVEVIVSEGVNFKHRILYEDYTGTWCGYCPIATKRYEVLKEQNPNVVFIGVHGPQGTTDPWITAASTSLISEYNVGEFPTMRLNRNMVWTYDFNYTDMSVPLGLIQASSKIGIGINSTATGNQLNATISLAFAENQSNLKYIVQLVETDLVHQQRNYYDGSGGKPLFYDGSPYVDNYVHENVLMENITPVLGTNIPNSNSMEGEVFDVDFSISLSTDYNPSNLKLIVLVVDNAGNVLNAREASINTENLFEYL